MHFLVWKCMHLIKISLKFVPMVRINNIPALVQIMAWRRIGDKPLSEPMMVNLLTHIPRPQWVKLTKCPRIITHKTRCHEHIRHHRFRQYLVACTAPNQCLYQCWYIINSTSLNEFHWNSNVGMHILFFITSTYIVCVVMLVLIKNVNKGKG